ncbi:MAG: hypothetical protein U0641_03390 [Anaerolineae bacterium]
MMDGTGVEARGLQTARHVLDFANEAKDGGRGVGKVFGADVAFEEAFSAFDSEVGAVGQSLESVAVFVVGRKAVLFPKGADDLLSIVERLIGLPEMEQIPVLETWIGDGKVKVMLSGNRNGPMELRGGSRAFDVHDAPYLAEFYRSPTTRTGCSLCNLHELDGVRDIYFDLDLIRAQVT